MKNSLIWRSLIVIAVLLACALSVFPLQDRDLLVVFDEMAQPRLEKYHKELDQAQEDLAAIQEDLATASEGTEAYQELLKQQAALKDAISENEALLDNYAEVMSEAQRLLEEDNDIRAPYRALKTAAQGQADRAPVTLRSYIPIFGFPQASNTLVLSRVRNKARAKLHLGLDLIGGTEFILGFDPEELKEDEDIADVRDQIIEIVRNRVDSLGVVEPEIREVGPSSISLEMPSVTEDAKADVRRAIKQTATLTFRLVHPNNDEKLIEYRNNRENFTIEPQYEREPRRMEIVNPDGSIDYQYLFLTNTPEQLHGEDIRSATPEMQPLGGYSVSLDFTTRGGKEFGQITSENVGRRLAILLDDTIYSAPVIRGPILQGRAAITGNFGPEEASRLATVINSGDLPVDIRILSEFGTDPTLGKDSIRSGTTAALAGLIAVLVFMILYYRVAGTIAVLALAANIVIVLGILGLSGATITLPGIAGIVLVIGMAVDANVLIFERIREEIENGKSIANALQAGYRRAFVTILDANLTTLITAVILLKVGTGPIRGFAVTLSIGVIASMFTALFMTRVIFDFLIHNGYVKKLSMANVVGKPNFNFLKLRAPALALSFILIVASLLGALVRGDSILGIDFAGGTALTYRVEGQDAPPITDVRAFLEEQGMPKAQPGYKYAAGTEGQLLEIVLPGTTDENNVVIDTLSAKLEEQFADAEISYAQTASVGEAIGKRFRMKALLAALAAAVAIIVYISFRFEFAYAIASVAALVHDVLVATGIYILCGRQLSLPVIAALLTIMGYSLNDTIVLFDRIREDLGLVKNKKYTDIINLSINQTLSRTLLTSFTTLLVVAILFLFGGGAINDFALVMMVGIIVGTYSSIFIASTIVAIWHKPTTAERSTAGA